MAERKAQANKAEGAAPGNASEQPGANLQERTIGNETAPAFKPDPAAGQHEGSFIARRTLEGDRLYHDGDEREGTVAELAHLVTSGAISPADAATAEAVHAYTGVEVEPYKPARKGR